MKANSPITRQLTERFFLHNRLTFALAAFAALVSGFTGLIVSWFLKALIDTASSVPDALPLGTVLRIIGDSFLVILLIALLDRIVRPALAWQVSNDILDLNGITRIVVTHSLEESLLRRYDGILVLKDGRITESGTFDELMASGGYFHALFTVAQ